MTAVDCPAMQVTGAPALFEGRLYVPISGGDDSAAIDPKFECCKGRGAIVALDAATGAIIWKHTDVPRRTRPLGRNSIGTQLWGPSGVSVWSSPTIDAMRRMLYVGTGDNHSTPATDSSDAVLAVSLDSGEIVWVRQLLAGDMGNAACLAVDKANCPEPHGPDFDLGASANLITLPNGKRLLTIGQKSGMVWALDPDDRGRIMWQARVGRGGPLGGVQWGTATDGRTVYVAVSDIAPIDLVIGQPIMLDPDRGGGLRALVAATGATLLGCAGGPCVRGPQELQSCAIGRGHRDAGLRFLRCRRWPSSRIRDGGRARAVGLRHSQAVRHRQQDQGERRLARFGGTDGCGWDDLRQLGLRAVRWAGRQRAARLRPPEPIR